MTKTRFLGVPLLLVMGFLANSGGVSLKAAQTSDLNLKVQLIWGTDGQKPKDPHLRDLTPKLEEKLRRVFKWKHYWEVGSPHAVSLPFRVTQKVQMSHKCELELKNLGNSVIEVKLYGEGKFVKKIQQPLKPGECSVLAGDDKDDNAWFVILSPKESSEGPPQRTHALTTAPSRPIPARISASLALPKLRRIS